MTVDKNAQRSIFKNFEKATEMNTKDIFSVGSLEIKEPERRLFSPNFGKRRKLNISNPRTVMNEFSVQFTDLKFKNTQRGKKRHNEIENNKFSSFS